jgi:hypothetical protein
MTATTYPSDSVTRPVRWLARGLSLLAAGMVVLFFVGEGGFNPLRLTGSEAVPMALFFTSWLGLLVAWRWELLGAAMTLGGMGLFYLAHYLEAGRWPRGWAFAFIASPAVFFLYCGLREWWGRRRLAG